jgi:hypothetical protein
MSDADVGAGGYRRARIRRPRNVPGWKPLLGAPYDGGVEGELIAGGVGAVPRRVRRRALPLAKTAVTANPKVRAGVVLLNAAEKNPAAKRKVTHIVRRAKAGDPQAISAVKTLRVAKAVKDRNKRKQAAAARVKRRKLAVATAVRPELPVGDGPAPRGLFRFYDKGSG